MTKAIFGGSKDIPTKPSSNIRKKLQERTEETIRSRPFPNDDRE